MSSERYRGVPQVAPTLIHIAALIERLGDSRDCHGDDTDDDVSALVWRRRWNAERASRLLFQRLINPGVPYRGAPGPTLKRLIEELLVLVHTSTPDDEPRVHATVHYRHVTASDTLVQTMILTALDLVLYAIEDGALDVALTLDEDDDDLLMRCVSQHLQFGLAKSVGPYTPRVVVGAHGPWQIQLIGADHMQIDVRLSKHAEEP